MALVVNDRVQQTGTANTTVSFTLTGSVTGFQSFAIIGNGNTTFYAATDAAGDWEVGLGTYSTTGPTLTRTTILSSSNSGSAVTFSGTVNIFVTYPSEKSVNLDASGNVTALGTITSAVWNGTTIPVAYGGTGVTSSSGANSVVLRDSNQNFSVNNIFQGYTSTVSSGTTIVLTAASSFYQRISGTIAQTIQFPNATTLQKGVAYTIDNDSTGTVTLIDNSSATLDTIVSGAVDLIVLLDNSTSAGTWVGYSYIPDTYDFGTNTASFGNATISNAVWNGTTIASGYGGTGLTTFTAANNALYSTSAGALTAGTLPAAAGGTGLTSSGASGNILQSNGTTWTSVANTAASAKAWANFNSSSGSAVIRASYNVSSITVSSTGLYYLSFTNPLVDANYALMGAVSNNSGSTSNVPYTLQMDYRQSSTQGWFSTGYNTGDINMPFISVAVFR